MVHTMDVNASNFREISEKIKREILAGEVVKEEEVAGLIGDHVRFVDLIMEKGYEGAYRMCSRVFDECKNIQY